MWAPCSPRDIIFRSSSLEQLRQPWLSLLCSLLSSVQREVNPISTHINVEARVEVKGRLCKEIWATDREADTHLPSIFWMSKRASQCHRRNQRQSTRFSWDPAALFTQQLNSGFLQGRVIHVPSPQHTLGRYKETKKASEKNEETVKKQPSLTRR